MSAGLEVGSIFARVGAVFDPAGWDRQHKAATQARETAAKPIHAQLGAKTDEAPISRWRKQVDGARLAAKDPITARTRMLNEPAGFLSFNKNMDESHGRLKSFDRDTESFVGHLGGMTGRLAVMGGGAAAMIAGFAGLVVLKDGVSRLGEMNRTAVITEARLKSTRDASRMTAKSIDELAMSIFRKTGIDHEQVASAANLELSFMNITNAAGKNRDMFTRTAQAAADLSVGTGKDLLSSMKALGIAINNPTVGMTRLSRAGIIFTAQQKDQIKAMMAAGDQFGAQNLILAEVQKRYGGTADAVGKTMPAAIARAKVSFLDLTAEMAKKLAPQITDIANWFSKLTVEVQNNTGAGRTIRTVISDIGKVISFTVTGLRDLARAFTSNSTEGKVLRAAVIGITTAFIGFSILKDVKGLIGDVGKAWGLLSAAFTASPFALVLGGIALLALAMQTMGIKWKNTGQFITAVWDQIKADVGAAVSILTGWVTAHKKDLDVIGTAVSTLAAGFGHLLAGILSLAGGGHVLKTLLETLGTLAGVLVHVIAGILSLAASKPGMIALSVAAAGLLAVLTPLLTMMAVEKMQAFGTAIIGVADSFRGAAIQAAAFARASITGNVSGAKTAFSRIFTPAGPAAPTGGMPGMLGGLTGVRGAGVGSTANPVVVSVMSGKLAGLGNSASAAEAESTSAVATTERTAIADSAGGGFSKSSSGLLVPSRASEAPVIAGAVAGSEGAAAAESGLLAGMGGKLMKGIGMAGMGYMGASMIGSTIGGKAGSAVTSIGGDASIGAGLGSMLGPGGTIAGGVLGGLVGAFTTFIGKDSSQYGQQISDNVTRGMGPAIRSEYGKGISSALNNASADLGKTRQVMPMNLRMPESEIRKLQSDAAGAYSKAGTMAGNAWVASVSQVKFTSVPTLVSSFLRQMSSMPARAKDTAALVAVKMAEGLEEKGSLPKGATEKMIHSLEAQMPGLQAFFHQRGMDTATDFAAQLTMDKARTTLANTVAALKTEFGILPVAATVTGKNMNENFSSSMAALKVIMVNGTSQARKAANTEFSLMQTQANTYYQGMTDQATAHMHTLGVNVKAGSHQAAKDVGTNFVNLQSAIGHAMGSGVLTADQGAKLISTALKAALKAFGSKQVVPAIASITAAGINSEVSNVTSSILSGFAAGGFLGYEGQVAPDSQLVMAAPGEAFLTGHDQPWVNRALNVAHRLDPGAHPFGSLGHMFGASSRPAHFASGGMVGASDFGGPSDPGTGSVGYRGDDLTRHPDSYAELNMGTALGSLPYLAPLDVTYAGKTARLYKRDIGAGGGNVGGHTRGLDLWWQAAESLGFPYPGLGLVDVSGNGKVNVNVGAGSSTAGVGAGATWSNINAPRVKGAGTVAAMAQAAVNMMTAGANQDGAAQAALAAPAGGSAGSLLNFQAAAGPVPVAVQEATAAARQMLGRPYSTSGQFYGLNAPGLDCSGYVSTILNVAGLDPAGHLLTGGLKQWGDAGPGKWITVGVLGADSGPTGHALDVSTPLLTAAGWKTMGTVEVGDQVYAEDGTPTAVQHVSPVFDEACFEVEFSDGATLTATADHRWKVWDTGLGRSRGWRVLSTSDMLKNYTRRTANGSVQNRYRVACDAVPQTPEVDLPIDPYILGYWLGDGDSTKPTLTVGIEDHDHLLAQLDQAGYRIVSDTPCKSEWGHGYHVAFNNTARRGHGIYSQLGALGVRGAGKKHIPDVYLNASPAQRRALLAGLLDSDGCCTKQPSIQFSSVSKLLATDVWLLARSLGARASLWPTAGDDWFVSWKPVENPFRMRRKAGKLNRRWAQRGRRPRDRFTERMSIISIREVPKVPTRCIAVEHSERVFLAGRAFTPTHNTMVEIDNVYYESGGGPSGPHIDPGGWSSFFPWKRHPPGLAHGGPVGAPGHQLTQEEFDRLKKGDMSVLAGRRQPGNPTRGFARGGTVTRPHAAPHARTTHGSSARRGASGGLSHGGGSRRLTTPASHTKGLRAISAALFGEIKGKGGAQIRQDVQNLNGFGPELADLDAQYNRLQGEQTTTDRQYGSNIPERIVVNQANALIKIKQRIADDLGRENTAAHSLGRNIGRWLPNRQRADIAARSRISEAGVTDTADANLILNLQGQLTSLSRRDAGNKALAARAKQEASLTGRIGKLKTSAAAALKVRPKAAKVKPPVQYDSYGNKLPAVPSTAQSTTAMVAAQQRAATDQTTINAVQSQLAALRNTPAVNPDVKQKYALQDAIKQAKAKLAKDKAGLKADLAGEKQISKEVAALQTIQGELAADLDPQTGLPGQVKDAKDAITSITTSLPAGVEGGEDYTILPGDEQAQLDQLNLQLSAAEGEPAGSQQTADETRLFGGLRSFWSSRLAELKREGAPTGALQDAQTNLNDATSQLSGLAATAASDYTVLPAGEQATLDQLNYQISQAQGLPDSQQATAEKPLYQSLAGFWQGRLGELKTQGAPVSALTDVQNNVDSALSQLTSLASNTTSDQSAQLSQDQTRIQNLQMLNASAAASLTALAGPGDIGSGGYGTALQAARSPAAYGTPAAGGFSLPAPAGQIPGMPQATVTPAGSGSATVNLTVNAMHPADPTVLAHIANSTVNALNGQNFTRANRQQVL